MLQQSNMSLIQKFTHFFFHEDILSFMTGSGAGVVMIYSLEQYLIPELLKFSIACATAFACGFIGMAGKDLWNTFKQKYKNRCKK